jgi:hypothetical protein
MKLTISDALFEKIINAEKRKEVSFLLEMTLANSWWSTQVGVKHLASYCPSYVRAVGIILNNIPVALIIVAVYLFFQKEIALGIFSLLLIIPLIYFVPKLSCKVVRFTARRNKMFFLDLYASSILHICHLNKKEIFTYPSSLEDVF